MAEATAPIEGVPMRVATMVVVDEEVIDAFATVAEFARVLGVIAQGRPDCGRPLAAETARQLAREALHAAGRSWPKQGGDVSR